MDSSERLEKLLLELMARTDLGFQKDAEEIYGEYFPPEDKPIRVVEYKKKKLNFVYVGHHAGDDEGIFEFHIDDQKDDDFTLQPGDDFQVIVQWERDVTDEVNVALGSIPADIVLRRIWAVMNDGHAPALAELRPSENLVHEYYDRLHMLMHVHMEQPERTNLLGIDINWGELSTIPPFGPHPQGLVLGLSLPEDKLERVLNEEFVDPLWAERLMLPPEMLDAAERGGEDEPTVAFPDGPFFYFRFLGTYQESRAQGSGEQESADAS